MIIQYNANFKIVDASSKQEVRIEEIRDRVAKISRLLMKIEINKSDVLFVKVKRTIDTVLIIIACIQLRITFTFCEDNSKESSHESNQKFRTTLVYDGKQIFRISENNGNDSTIDDICYVIYTSGTSGNIRKQVAVPVSCIEKNVEYFCSIFHVEPSDSILFSTSLQFDPSIIELFMAFHVGCQLVLTPDNFRNEPHRLQNAIEEFRPTIAQFTPTVFEMLPSPDSLLSATSSLRILLLGGSNFPLSFINSVRSPDNQTRVFNVYGVTEVSCWATSFEVEVDCPEVLIGTEITGTTLEIDSNDQLVLGGSRQCYVNGRKGKKHETGDRVRRTENGAIKLVGRVDRMIKHRGIRICLDDLSELATRENSSIQSVHFIHFNNRHIVQFISGPDSTSSTDTSHTKIMKLDDSNSIIVFVIHVASLPINSSGKVDENELRRISNEHFIKVCRDTSSIIQEFLKRRRGIDLTNVLDQSFVSIGINSLMAAELSISFGEIQEVAMREILNDKITIRSFLNQFVSEKLEELDHEESETIKIKVSIRRQPRMNWAVDLCKCIDGSILVLKLNLIICASHSGIVVAVNPLTGDCLWRTNCGVRFECKPISVKNFIVIGSKKSGLYFLRADSGELFKTQKYEEDFGIRSQCASDGKLIYCTTENGYFHAIDSETHLSIFRQLIDENGGGTSIGPVISSDGSIFVTTTSGCLTRILVKYDSQKHPVFNISFFKRFGPIFSEIVFLDANSILISSVHGVLTILNSKTGEEKESISLENENCFCAPLKTGNKLIVATQSGKIITLNISAKLTVSKIFQFDVPGISFVKTPKLIDPWNSLDNSPKLMMISKNGMLLFGRFENLETLEEVSAFPISNKEVFTSPEFFNYYDQKFILIAGRDDYLRSWKFDQF
ncbi:hypothetical protein CRE_04673 [Caenorhabditis remanei]|uniref:Uncharacterized protein n=1 Tax=Caenorhabditis remanei TaxID=31234 RepID=E3LYM3_CAERE|nr:hypothetical protein CRE_04673 [Caenorhabditis remanei]